MGPLHDDRPWRGVGASKFTFGDPHREDDAEKEGWTVLAVIVNPLFTPLIPMKMNQVHLLEW